MQRISCILIFLCYIHSHAFAQCDRFRDLVADYRSFIVRNDAPYPGAGPQQTGGRDIITQTAQANSYQAAVDIYQTSLDTSFFNLSPQQEHLPDHLEKLCSNITGITNLSFKEDNVMIRLKDGSINIAPMFIKWLLVIAFNEQRVHSSSFNQLVADKEEMQRYCNGRARTPADYAEFYTIATKDLTRSLQHLGQVAQRLTPDCDTDCLAQLKAELGNSEGKALQQLLMLAGVKHAGSGLGIFVEGDL